MRSKIDKENYEKDLLEMMAKQKNIDRNYNHIWLGGESKAEDLIKKFEKQYIDEGYIDNGIIEQLERLHNNPVHVRFLVKVIQFYDNDIEILYQIKRY